MGQDGAGRRSMLVVLASIVGVSPVSAGGLSTLSPVGPPRDRRSVARSEIRDKLMAKMHGMNAAQQGIFSEDVTEVVAPYFPAGQPLKTTEAVLAREGLGSLRKFRGEQDPSQGSMYVSSFDLMNGMGSTVYVVIDFDLDGDTRSTMTVRTVRAFIRSKSM